MPTSHYRNIPDIVSALLAIDPVSLLEIGIGMGKWGLLAREYLQVWPHVREPWGARPLRLEGIEVFETYRNAAWAVYDAVHVGDALDVLPGLGVYQAVLMVDVLEHFTHTDGERLLASCAEHAETSIIGLPSRFAPTSAAFGNAYEVHRCAWTPEEFAVYGTVTVHKQDAALIVTIRHWE